MLPANHKKFASVTAVMLFACIAMSADHSSICFLPVDAQEPPRPEGKPSKLQELQKERLAALREYSRVVAGNFKNGKATAFEVMEATRSLLEAELELCESNKDRAHVLGKFLVEAKDNERIATSLAKAGLRSPSMVFKARAERLRIEIALERLNAEKDAPLKGATKSEPSTPTKVATIKPKSGVMERISVQAGVIQAYESVRVFAWVPGVLKTQRVDIGDRVKRGDVLAVLDASDLETQLEHASAVVDQSRARVIRAEAGVNRAKADLEIAGGTVKQAEANVQGAAAGMLFREKQWKRLKELFDAKSIEERVLDESKEQYLAAVEADQSAKAAVATAKAQVVAAQSKIEQAQAEVAAVKADVKVAQTKLLSSKLHLSRATIAAPFDGVITQRGYSPGEFIRAANTEPLVTVQRTDLVRVVVMIPERDVPFLDPGDAAIVELEALPGKKWPAQVSRMTGVLDQESRLMRVEIDLANPTGQIRPGMHGKVTILLARGTNVLSIR